MGLLSFMYRQLTFKAAPLAQDTLLSGQTILITGANTGIGFEAARELAAHGTKRLILGVRSTSKGDIAAKKIVESNPECEVRVWELDNNSYHSIVNFAQRTQTLDRLDSVLLNAGMHSFEYTKSPETGHEITVQVNHLATALLSLMLLPKLKSTASKTQKPSRLTITTSEVHMWVKFKERNAPDILQEMDRSGSFGVPERYYVSKLLNILWARQLASKVDPSEVIVNMVNPGLCWSSLHRDDPGMFMHYFKVVFAWSTAQGGHCIADATFNGGPKSHGQYLSEQQITEYENHSKHFKD